MKTAAQILAATTAAGVDPGMALAALRDALHTESLRLHYEVSVDPESLFELRHDGPNRAQRRAARRQRSG